MGFCKACKSNKKKLACHKTARGLVFGWFSALFFGLNSLTWACCEFAFNQASLAHWHWVLRRAPRSAILVASSISCEVGRRGDLFSHWLCLRPDHLGKHCSLGKGSHEPLQLAIAFEAVQKLAYLKNQIAKIRMAQGWKGWSVNLHKMLLAPDVRRTQHNVWSGRPVSHSKPS